MGRSLSLANFVVGTRRPPVVAEDELRAAMRRLSSEERARVAWLCSELERLLEKASR